jgi:hypothetical protein
MQLFSNFVRGGQVNSRHAIQIRRQKPDQTASARLVPVQPQINRPVPIGLCGIEVGRFMQIRINQIPESTDAAVNNELHRSGGFGYTEIVGEPGPARLFTNVKPAKRKLGCRDGCGCCGYMPGRNPAMGRRKEPH